MHSSILMGLIFNLIWKHLWRPLSKLKQNISLLMEYPISPCRTVNELLLSHYSDINSPQPELTISMKLDHLVCKLLRSRIMQPFMTHKLWLWIRFRLTIHILHFTSYLYQIRIDCVCVCMKGTIKKKSNKNVCLVLSPFFQ